MTDIKKEDPVDVMFWNENKKEGKTMLRINVKASFEMEFGDKLKVSVALREADGVKKPLTAFTKDGIDGTNWTLMGHFEYEHPGAEVGKVVLEVETELIHAPKYKA